jgi:hypothetical protein
MDHTPPLQFFNKIHILFSTIPIKLYGPSLATYSSFLGHTVSSHLFSNMGKWREQMPRAVYTTMNPQCVQAFYKKYEFGNALTVDFQEVVESLSGKSHEEFFRQWFYQSGHPVLSAQWKKRGKKIILTITQHQDQSLFNFPLDVEFVNDQGESFRKTLSIGQSTQTFTLKPFIKPTELRLDPDTWLLFETYESP